MTQNYGRQQGIAHLVIIFAILLLAVGGFAGWKIISGQQDAAVRTLGSPASKSAANAPEQPVVPTGYVVFEAKELELRFAYPKAWGTATVREGSETKHLIAGKEYAVLFSGNAKVSAGVRSYDWKHNPEMGHDGTSDLVLGFASADFPMKEEADGTVNGIPAKVFLNNSTSLGMSTSFGSLGCDGVGEVLVHSLQKRAYPSIAFMTLNKQIEYGNFSKESGTSPEDICSETNYIKYISSENAEILKKIDATIVPL